MREGTGHNEERITETGFWFIGPLGQKSGLTVFGSETQCLLDRDTVSFGSRYSVLFFWGAEGEIGRGKARGRANVPCYGFRKNSCNGR